jgi:hypothetical protein
MTKLSIDNVVAFNGRRRSVAASRPFSCPVVQIRLSWSALVCAWQRDARTGRLQCTWFEAADDPSRLRLSA